MVGNLLPKPKYCIIKMIKQYDIPRFSWLIISDSPADLLSKVKDYDEEHIKISKLFMDFLKYNQTEAWHPLENGSINILRTYEGQNQSWT